MLQLPARLPFTLYGRRAVTNKLTYHGKGFIKFSQSPNHFSIFDKKLPSKTNRLLTNLEIPDRLSHSKQSIAGLC